MSANNGALMTPTLIVTRPLAQSESFAAQLKAAWGKPMRIILSPLLEIVPIPVAMPVVETVIFTSVNGVNAAAELNLPNGLTAWCVGNKTAAHAKAAGFEVKIGPGDARGLVDDLISAQPVGTIAHIRGIHTRGDVAERLNAAGLPCIDVPAYDQRAASLSDEALEALSGTDPVVLPLFSPRTSTILTAQGPFSAPACAVALSEAVKNSLGPALGWHVRVAERPETEAMLDALVVELDRIVSEAIA